ncbi:lysin B [Nocardia phage NS-I]|nr:lysin B [Nocardia phage NS-I]
MGIVVIRNRGIGEPVPGPMLSAVTNLLPESWTRRENTEWVAQYGPAGLNAVKLPFLDAVDRGAAGLVAMVHEAMIQGHRAVLLGYSGGAVVVHRALERMSDTELAQVAAVGFISDPEQPRGLPNTRGRFGIRGGTPLPVPMAARWAYDPDDGICLCPDPSPLRSAAQWSADIGLGSPLAWEIQLRRFITLRRVPAYVFNVWDLQGEIARWAEAKRLLEGYLGKDHVSYATRKEPGTSRTYVQNMATWLQGTVETATRPR